MSAEEGRCVRCGEEVYRRNADLPWRTVYVNTYDTTRCPNVGGADVGPHDVEPTP